MGQCHGLRDNYSCHVGSFQKVTVTLRAIIGVAVGRFRYYLSDGLGRLQSSGEHGSQDEIRRGLNCGLGIQSTKHSSRVGVSSLPSAPPGPRYLAVLQYDSKFSHKGVESLPPPTMATPTTIVITTGPMAESVNCWNLCNFLQRTFQRGWLKYVKPGRRILLVTLAEYQFPQDSPNVGISVSG